MAFDILEQSIVSKLIKKFPDHSDSLEVVRFQMILTAVIMQSTEF
jgi:hypothetical protein